MLIALVLGALPATATRAAPTWELPGVDVRLVVRADGAIEVTEVLHANFGSGSRTGLRRAIPTLLNHPDAGPLRIRVDLRAVEDGSGTPLPHRVEKTPRHLVVTTEEHAARGGPVNYRLEYTVEGAVVRQPTRDVLLWPAVGGEWDAAIWEVEVIVELPDSVDTGGVRAGSFTGDHGERGHAADVHTIDPARVTYRLLRGLKAYQRFTIECSWPRVPGPARGNPVWWSSAVAGGTALMIAFLLLARRRR